MMGLYIRNGEYGQLLAVDEKRISRSRWWALRTLAWFTTGHPHSLQWWWGVPR